MVLVDPDRGLRIGILGMMTPPLIAVTRGTPIPKGRVVSLQSHSRGATIEEQQMRERETGSNLGAVVIRHAMMDPKIVAVQNAMIDPKISPGIANAS